jgi:Protein of unknown function (DUF3467)
MQSTTVRPQDSAVFGNRVHASGYAYVNQFEVGFSRDEVLLRLSQAYQGVDEQAYQAHIVMTPAYAKALLLLLADAMARYEAQHGEVLAAGAGVAQPGESA